MELAVYDERQSVTPKQGHAVHHVDLRAYGSRSPHRGFGAKRPRRRWRQGCTIWWKARRGYWRRKSGAPWSSTQKGARSTYSKAL